MSKRNSSGRADRGIIAMSTFDIILSTPNMIAMGTLDIIIGTMNVIAMGKFDIILSTLSVIRSDLTHAGRRDTSS
jgi:hypothetical protein